MKKSFNKFMAAGTTVAVVATAVTPAAFAADHPFTDVSAKYEEAVTFLYGIGAVNGRSATQYGTYESITRGDAAVILADVLGLDTENAEDVGFKDLFPRVEGAVNALAAEGIVAGTSPDEFSPHKPLSRGALAKFLVIAFGLEEYEVDSHFTDVSGVLGPYIEALYGAGITSGKTATTYGTYQNITRGDFANLLYGTIEFVWENAYWPIVQSANVDSQTSFTFTFDEAAPEDYTAEEVFDLFISEFVIQGEAAQEVVPTKVTLSTDRKSLTVEHSNNLDGKSGVLVIDGDIEVPFDFAAPVATTGTITLEGVAQPQYFDFAGQTMVTVGLPAVNGSANLNGMELTVTDTFTAGQTVSIILKDTSVESEKTGINQTWGILTYGGGKWNLQDQTKYDVIPAGTYKLEAPFKDVNGNEQTYTMNIEVK